MLTIQSEPLGLRPNNRFGDFFGKDQKLLVGRNWELLYTEWSGKEGICGGEKPAMGVCLHGKREERILAGLAVSRYRMKTSDRRIGRGHFYVLLLLFFSV